MIHEILYPGDVINVMVGHDTMGHPYKMIMLNLKVLKINGDWLFMEESEPDENSQPGWYNSRYFIKFDYVSQVMMPTS